ncbi:uncharacterized protein LOC126911752 [Spodoptera frugiperda]|uniref:Uncharacterized protein LOC126911752 n=1 Tax=Spodoptera frugiperda TaxID=7108 RepID=A0A9R0E022_SPOFR|nr:uncharacterized protein LOC126911752 [Spodoptera frugiperda]
MSSKSSRKVATRAKVEPIVTRTKSAQQRRQLKNKEKKTEKPELTKQQTKSTNQKTDKCLKKALPEPIKIPDDVIEQVEYYPDKLKREPAKKIRLKPKHNFTVIATTNKRKLATPQKGIKSPPPLPTSSHSLLKSPKTKVLRSSSPEPTVQDMVRIMEESRSLSDEDFMEILTCPSPVWWEDPPDGGYSEDAIIMISPEPPTEKASANKKRKIFKNPPNNNIENKMGQIKTIEGKKDEKFVKKQRKLENVLGNIKNKGIKQIDNAKDHSIDEPIIKLSESEGEISDISFNEEEILKNLENMDIPVETLVKSERDTKSVVKKEKNPQSDSEITLISENIDDTSASVDLKPKIKEELAIISKISNNTEVVDVNSQCDVSLRKNDINSVENSNLKNSVDAKCNTDLGCASIDTNNSITMTKDATLTKNNVNKLITVRKIKSEHSKNDKNIGNELKSTENSKNLVIDSVRGKLDDFFKQCKNSKRIKKGDSPIPAISLTDVKEETTDNEENGNDSKTKVMDEDNRLKSCECEKTENSCEKCEKAVILPCDSCNFLAETNEVYKKHIVSCKDIARIQWSHNLVLNQT